MVPIAVNSAHRFLFSLPNTPTHFAIDDVTQHLIFEGQLLLVMSPRQKKKPRRRRRNILLRKKRNPARIKIRKTETKAGAAEE